MIGRLFTQEFLKTGICDTPAWKAITDEEIDGFIAAIKSVYMNAVAAGDLSSVVKV